MGLTDKVFGPSYKVKTIRRQVRNGQQDNVIMDRAALVEDDITEEKQLKFKSDGKTIPKPSNLSFDNLQTKSWFGGSSDFLEIEEDGDQTSIINFNKKENRLTPERAEKEHIFQAHRNFLNKKTMEAWSSEDNTEIYILATIALIVVVNLAGQYFIVNGLQQGVADGVIQGFQNIDLGAATGATGN